MMKCSTSDLKVSQSDMLVELVGKIVAAFRDDGFSFSAKLVSIHDDECWFQSRSGVRFMVSRGRITGIREVVPRHMRQ